MDSKVPKRYAKALLGLGQEDGNYEAYGQNLKVFADFCATNDEFFQVVSNQIFSVDDRKKILETVLARFSFSGMVNNFLNLLLVKKRIKEVDEISNHYSRLTDEITSITRAKVVTARPLKGDALERLVQALKGITSKDVKVNVEEDASIMGGLIVQIGDLVLDGSIKTQLEGLRESLKRGEYN